MGVVFVALDDSLTACRRRPAPCSSSAPTHGGASCAPGRATSAPGWWPTLPGSGGLTACPALAPLRDATPRTAGASIPEATRLLDLLAFDALDA